MTTLVSGAAGFVGSAACGALARAGHEVHALVRPGTSTRRLVGLPVEVHRVDLHDRTALTDVVARVGPRVVVHAAASAGHGAGDRDSLWLDTVQATVRLLDALDTAPPARVVHVASSTEYAPSPRALREDDPRPPECPRGAAKAAAWLAVREWAGSRGVGVTALRLFRVYGPHEPEGRLVPAILRALDDGTPVPLPSGPVGRDWVHVDDVAEACVRATRDVVATQVLNVGRGVSLPPEAVVAAFGDAAGREVPVLPGAWDRRAIDVEHWRADLTALEAAWGWRPGIDLPSGAELTLRAHRGERVGA
ncbi:SDR family oxidoreductase [Nocardioides glacieisoli]|jgi:nucleoside-diphosphate-sugar epimerase|uniref:SDR family oxidoreductase n=1 Tax=Nocardioides glacieisoli TaxID=1168730 RepID=A0A4Q2S8I4_9ACTN|nr:NAD-dependent epimerase/dehydratase family protein [Nocardioides glacieisoli]RYB96739.1 SDR family oxidoreductase [Nocardioides glacieisoli]